MSGRSRLGAQIRALEVAAAIGAAVVIGGPAWGQDIKVPTDPVAKAAFEVLDKHCARCHQVGKLTARERPSKNFGNVLQLDELADNPGLIRPGNAFASNLFKQIIDKEMPYDVIYEGAAGPLISRSGHQGPRDLDQLARRQPQDRGRSSAGSAARRPPAAVKLRRPVLPRRLSKPRRWCASRRSPGGCRSPAWRPASRCAPGGR